MRKRKRLGIADLAHGGPPHTPWLALQQVVDTSVARAVRD